MAPATEHRVEHVMGMPVSIAVCGALDPSGFSSRGAAGPGALDRVCAWLHDVDRTFSTYRHDSEISRIDRGSLALCDASAHVREVLALCESARHRTRGFFDARATGRLDPSGLVKGWALDAAARLLAAAGASRFLINAGGDVVLRGEPPWRVGIQHPQRRDGLACAVELSNCAIATSGPYERGFHVLDPHTGRAPDGVLSVTVIGPELTFADAYATAALAMGTAGPTWTAGLVGYDSMTILEDGRVLSTPGFLDHCPGRSIAASLATAA